MEHQDSPHRHSHGNPKHVLAIDPSFGSAFICSHCGLIHLQLSSVDLAMTLEGFQCLAVLMNRATANFELWADSNPAAS